MKAKLEKEPLSPPTGSPEPFEPASGPRWPTAPTTANPPGLKMAIHRCIFAIIKRMPMGLVRIFAGAYIAGDTREEALLKADRLHEKDLLLSTLDVLGEDVHCQQDIDDYNSEFEKLIDAMENRPHANVSLKMSALGQEQNEEACYLRVHALVERAHKINTFVRLDMEDHTTIDSTLRIYRRLRERFDNCGIVLQSRLFRTREDIDALMPLKPNVRLCIGIYQEPADIALQKKAEMKTHLLELLEIIWRNGQHVGIATHEEWVIRAALKLAEKLEMPMENVEIQMLLGVPRSALQKELIARGATVRLYVPYGEKWHAYSMRRLENNPDMLWMTIAAILKKIIGRS